LPGYWIVERVEEDRFPYRIRIEGAGGDTLCLRAQDRWPAAGRSLFCLREKEPPAYAEEIERVPVTSITRFGRRLTVILERKQKKRCDFLFLTKEYRDRPGETYEQIFWHTQAFLHKHRAKIKLSLNAKLQGLTVAVDTHERYPWSFSGKAVRRQLPVGDYALLEGERIRAVVERKTFENLIAEFGRLVAFHQQLEELSLYDYPAVVVEAEYGDFLNPKKQGFYSPSFCAKAIAEITARHPRVQFVFCGSRKLAAEWTRQFFAAVAACNPEPAGRLVLGEGTTPE